MWNRAGRRNSRKETRQKAVTSPGWGEKDLEDLYADEDQGRHSPKDLMNSANRFRSKKNR